MEPVVYSWIAAAAGAPLLVVLLGAILSIFHAQRQHWRSVDLFFVALLSQEIIVALLIFGYSLLTLMRPQVYTLCGAFVWGLTATHTMQAMTLTSMLVDRALTIRWPYRYRFNVRRNQIRYHIAVLAIISMFVGVAAIFARPVTEKSVSEQCSFLPHSLDIKFSLFSIILHGLLIVITIVTLLLVQFHLCLKGPLLRTVSELNTLTPTVSDTSTTSTTASGAGVLPPPPRYSTGGAAAQASVPNLGLKSGLYSGSSNSSHDSRCSRSRLDLQRMSALDRMMSDFRWASVASTMVVCYLLNHLPFLCLMVIGTFFPHYLPPWPLPNVVVWFFMAEGFLLPIVVALSDPVFQEWLAETFTRKQGKKKKAGEDGRFRLPVTNTVVQEIKFPLTNGSLFTSVTSGDTGIPVIHNYRRGRTPGGKLARIGVPTREIRGIIAGPPHLRGKMVNNPQLNPFSEVVRNTRHTQLATEPLYSDPMTKGSQTDTDLKYMDDEHIYATLSETFGSNSSINDPGLNEEMRCSSATTVANDDFEFHATRPCMDIRKEVNCRQCSGSQNNVDSDLDVKNLSSLPSTLCSTSSTITATLDDTGVTDETSSSSDDSDNDLVLGHQTEGQDYSFENHAFERDNVLKQENKVREFCGMPYEIPMLTVYQLNKDSAVLNQTNRSNSSTLNRRLQKASSLSMNDLDLLECDSLQDEEEMLFVVPVKSESMMSLYRLHLQELTGGENTRTIPEPTEPSLSEENFLPVGKDSRNYCDNSGGSNMSDYIRSSIVLSHDQLVSKVKLHRGGYVHKSQVPCIERRGRQMYRKNPSNSGGVKKCRLSSSKEHGSMLSLNALCDALSKSDISFMDNGELCTHDVNSTSDTDRKVFVTEYI